MAGTKQLRGLLRESCKIGDFRCLRQTSSAIRRFHWLLLRTETRHVHQRLLEHFKNPTIISR